MPIELYKRGEHLCLSFCDLIDEQHDSAVQANQFLIVDHGHGALIDPGSTMTYSPLVMAMQRYFPSRSLDYILASHADPDVVSSVNKWLVTSQCKVLISDLWTHFVPHITSGRDIRGRIEGIPDQGMDIRLGECVIKALPAHFLHSQGNFQFYDPLSKILFSGDMGASFVTHQKAAEPVRDFNDHLIAMSAYHRRYMVSNRVCRYWANMVRHMDVRMIVPQHGSRFEGRDMVRRFLDWIERLPCGIDLMTQDDYRLL